MKFCKFCTLNYLIIIVSLNIHTFDRLDTMQFDGGGEDGRDIVCFQELVKLTCDILLVFILFRTHNHNVLIDF